MAVDDQRLDDMIGQARSGSTRMSEADALAMAGALYGRGRFDQAESACRQLIAHNPKMPDAHSLLGLALDAQGRTQEAAASLRRAIELAPGVAAHRSNLGEVQRRHGRLAEAVFLLREALALDPWNAKAHNNLGIAEFDGGDFAAAAAAYRTAIDLQPSFAEAYNNLGNALRRLGDRDAAIEAYQNALAIRETYPEVYNNLGTLLRELDRGEQAEKALFMAIAQKPDYVEARNNLASYYFVSGRDVDALHQLVEVLQSAPADVTGLILTARIQNRRANHSPAEKAVRAALRIAPDHPEALTVLGLVLHETDRHAEGVEVLERAVRLAPDNLEALNCYGVTLKSVGRLADASEQILKCLELNPQHAGAYVNLSDLVNYSAEPELFERLGNLTEDAQARGSGNLLALHYAYGKALDDVGQHEKALDHYIAGSRMKRALLDYNEPEMVRFFENVRKIFTADLFRNRPYDGNPTDRLVFIVGMPRSGSTLVEQILGSHGQVHGAGEVKYLNQVLAKARDRFPTLPRYPAMALEMTPDQYRLVADGYERAMFAAAGDARIVSDKLLTNYLYVGLIHLLFPNARIINTRRDPVDCCVSAFTKLFKDDMPHSYDMGELGRYYRQYDALMKHWEDVLPEGVMKVVEYEKVVADTEKEAREIVEFVGLEWDKTVLDFHKSDRPVKTASVAQVRKPIYKTSMQRWKRYGAGLQPLIDAIEQG